MPQLVVPLAQGNTFGLTAEGGGAFTATRQWKVILNSANESLDIVAATGVGIGTPYSPSDPIPCVSLEGRADGDSRLVRIITATYRATPGNEGAGTPGEPGVLSPIARPATYSMTTSLTEIPAWGYRTVEGGSSGPWEPATNPAGDIIDGLSRLEPVLNITIEQYQTHDASGTIQYTGYVNSDAFSFSTVQFNPHCCMFQGVSSSSVIEQFGSQVFRGFRVAFTFAARNHMTLTRNGAESIGWDQALLQTGFNIINDGLGSGMVDQGALVLEHEDGKVKNPPQLAAGSQGKKRRAMVTLAGLDGGEMQRPASLPVPLNDDGTPRSKDSVPPVWINRVCFQPEMTFGPNFSSFGVRL